VLRRDVRGYSCIKDDILLGSMSGRIEAVNNVEADPMVYLVRDLFETLGKRFWQDKVLGRNVG
jgi:hypothetical protein